MTDYDDLIQRLISEANDTKYMLGHASSLHTAAADAIKELVAERDEYKGKWDAVSDRCNSALFDLKYARKLAESLTRRAEKAEAALEEVGRKLATLNYGTSSSVRMTIAAARAEGGE